MTKLKKTIASLAACVLMTSALALNVSAEKRQQFPVGSATATAYLDVTSTSATASTSLNVAGGSVSVSIVGTYYVKGTTTQRTNSNGNAGTTAAQTSIINGGGTWISVYSTHSATYNGSSGGPITLTW